MSKAFKTEAGKQEVFKAYESLAKSTSLVYEEINIQTKYGNTYLMAMGEKELPVLLLLHGSGINSLMWLNEMNLYKENYRVYAVDMIGEPGKSDEEQLPFGTDDYSNWLNEVVEKLGAERVSIVGISLGAWLGTKFATKYPEKVDKLVLLCPAGIGKQKIMFLVQSIFYGIQGAKGIKKLMTKVNGGEEMPQEIIDYQILIGKNFNYRREVIPIYSDIELKKLTMPVSLFVGEKDIMLHSKSTADRLGSLLPHAEINYLKDRGHTIVHFGNDIRKFLNK